MWAGVDGGVEAAVVLETAGCSHATVGRHSIDHLLGMRSTRRATSKGDDVTGRCASGGVLYSHQLKLWLADLLASDAVLLSSPSGLTASIHCQVFPSKGSSASCFPTQSYRCDSAAGTKRSTTTNSQGVLDSQENG